MRNLLLCASLFVSCPSYSEVTIVESSNDSSYVVQFYDQVSIKPNQSLNDAKSILLTKAKSDASQLIGGHVYTSLLLDGDLISRDEVAVITSHHVKILDSKFSTYVDSEGDFYVKLTSTLYVEDNVVDNEVAKWTEMELLKTTNAELQKKNDELIGLILGGSNTSNTNVVSNQTGIEINFKAEDQNFDSLSYSKLMVANSVFSDFAGSIKVDFGELKTVKREDGTFDVYVQYGWEGEHAKYKKRLGEVINVLPDVFNHNKGSVIIKASSNDSDELDKKLYEYLTGIKMTLLFEPVSTKYHPVEVKLTGTRSIDFEGEVFQFQVNKNKERDAELSSMGKYLVFKSIPFEDIYKFRVINFKVIIE